MTTSDGTRSPTTAADSRTAEPPAVGNSNSEPFTVRPLVDYPERERVLELASAHAKDVDRNDDSPFTVLRELGREGLLTLGLEGSLAHQAAVVHDLATECTATAFSLWAHRSTIQFLHATGREIPDGLRTAAEPGSTAMAPAFKAAAGIGEIPVTLTRKATSGSGQASDDGGTWVLNGVIPWASNLYPEGHVVLPALRSASNAESRSGDSNGSGQESAQPVIVTVRTAAPGISVRPLQDLMALDSTASGILSFQDTPVDAEAVLTEDVPSFLAAVRAPFLLLQAAFCVGLSGAALESADQALTGVAEVFRPDRDTVVAEYQRVRTALLEYLETPHQVAFRDVLQLRLDAALLTGEATRLESKTVGGKGYALRSATARRAREAAFLPVQSPTESHLRFLLAQTPSA